MFYIQSNINNKAHYIDNDETALYWSSEPTNYTQFDSVASALEVIANQKSVLSKFMSFYVIDSLSKKSIRFYVTTDMFITFVGVK